MLASVWFKISFVNYNFFLFAAVCSGFAVAFFLKLAAVFPVQSCTFLLYVPFSEFAVLICCFSGFAGAISGFAHARFFSFVLWFDHVICTYILNCNILIVFIFF